ncbi:bifunctional adenosylcobinamide kinase/adenosylcobinamide-phosphate guanylyltransferase [Desulfotomaculum copahuensis]|uniref:Adenosylcobinamide kinase n=1 Tax=Desulfotomaculum copahuensis TaxID=1838280 RepID=A0A1B7LJM1_9FIRM|nr:bifunctional adenosylcobinamide kinase/adenosylcobinamide-phosphate guanylyltransferase [Desulfotomaculum copahuensis]OAT86769.1 bifunctional adenosylcobinamide kinase/adenosylcobinamide-phosphate guanylyltransferase [Desulfotomaculum copahuensis]
MALILVLGGARSGKSGFAEELAGRAGPRVVYVATATVGDQEMARRVAHHRARRPAAWQTVEESFRPEEVVRVFSRAADAVLVDCLTMWITNLLLHDPERPVEETEALILERVRALADAAGPAPARVILVSNEVGLGLVPDNPLGRNYRDIAGRVNQYLARRADQVYLVVAGLPVEIKSLSRTVAGD